MPGVKGVAVLPKILRFLKVPTEPDFRAFGHKVSSVYIFDDKKQIFHILKSYSKRLDLGNRNCDSSRPLDFYLINWVRVKRPFYSNSLFTFIPTNFLKKIQKLAISTALCGTDRITSRGVGKIDIGGPLQTLNLGVHRDSRPAKPQNLRSAGAVP